MTDNTSEPIAYVPWHPDNGYHFNFSADTAQAASARLMMAVECAAGRGWEIRPVFTGAPQTVLTWAPNAKPNDNCHYDHTTAETPFGSYRIEWKSWKDYPGYGIEFDGQFLTEESTLEDAKDTALADFNKRLTACLALTRPNQGGDK